MIKPNQKIHQWDENLTVPELMKLNGVSMAAIYVYAKRTGKRFKPRPHNTWGDWQRKKKTENHDYHLKRPKYTDRQREWADLVSRFHRGDDTVIPRLAEIGIKAIRMGG